MNELSGWGRFPKIKTRELTPQSESELVEILRNSDSYIPRGNGRSYGDSAINKNLTVTMTRMNRLLQWNQDSCVPCGVCANYETLRPNVA